MWRTARRRISTSLTDPSKEAHLKQRILLLLLALTLLTVPALAAESGMEAFARSKSYSRQFSDLPADSPFYSNVSALYEYGLSVGKGDGTFGLKDPLTVGQAVIFAGRIRSLYRTGDAELGPAAHVQEGQPTAQPYLSYLCAEDVLDDGLAGRLTLPATRAEMAHILANVLPEEALPSLHHDLVAEAYATGRFIADVTEYTPYYQDILKLYRCGVSVGSDAAGSFLPEHPITRGAAAAMLTRMIAPDLRAAPQWNLAPSVSHLTLADLVVPGQYIAAPSSPAEMEESVRFMLASGSDTLRLSYTGYSFDEMKDRMHLIMQDALAAVKQHCEQGYNTVTCVLEAPDALTLTFSASGDGGQTAAHREEALRTAVAVHDRLWNDGILAAGMTELEKARVYYDWICAHAAYDWNARADSLSHTPYNLLVNGLAVCDGYTGAYNLLLKLEGISCGVVLQGDHIWTSAVLDGTEVHIDVTWGDQDDRGIDNTYFAMTPEDSLRLHQT